MDKLKFVMSKMWTFLLPFIKILMSQAGPILANSAMKAVGLVATSSLSNEDKRANAFQSIADDLKLHGIEAATSVINMAIEAAVVKMKEAS